MELVRHCSGHVHFELTHGVGKRLLEPIRTPVGQERRHEAIDDGRLAGFRGEVDDERMRVAIMDATVRHLVGGLYPSIIVRQVGFLVIENRDGLGVRCSRLLPHRIRV